jgi:hypothetical protein
MQIAFISICALLFLIEHCYCKAILVASDDDLSGENLYRADVTCKTLDDPGNRCLPQRCSRLVQDDVFSEEDIDKLRSIATKGFATRGIDGKGEGGPTILDINTGYIRDSAGIENLFSREGSDAIFTDDDFAVYGQIIARLRREVIAATGAAELFFTAPTFITRLDGRPSWKPKEIHDQYWHVHADRNNTEHYHYSGLLYMSMFGDDFSGGRVIFYDADSSQVDLVVEPRPGRMLIFSSGHENPHKVERVTAGQRLVLAFWFTCNPQKQFEIFLDGKAHTSFSHKVGASIRAHHQQTTRQSEYDQSRQDSSEAEL